MKIKKCIVSQLETNCYLITNELNEGLIVDPGDDFNIIKKMVGDVKIVGVLVTHRHFDHISALDETLEYYNVEENNFDYENFDFEVIETPGHAKELLTFYFPEDKIMFTGDFIFLGTIGRCDLEGSSIPEMIESLGKIKKYPDDILIYPGHGNTTTLGFEKLSFDNYF